MAAEETVEVVRTKIPLSVRSLELGKGIVESVRALPASLAQLTALESLCLRDSEVTTLPSFVGLLPCLLDLQLRSNHRLEAVAPEVFSSAAGEQLECLLVNDCSKITAVPEELALCTRLLSCTITQCHLAAVPAGLVTLGRLRHLRLFQNDIAALPDYWSALHLQELDVSGNDLTSLPDAVVTCVSLRVLKAQRNHLAFLPSELGRLAALEEIDVARNVLVALPEAAGLVNLRRLAASDNQLRELPEASASWITLTELDLERNKIETVPAALFSLQRLSTIKLRGNPLYSHRTDTCGRDVLELQSKRMLQERAAQRAADAAAAAEAAAAASPTPDGSLIQGSEVEYDVSAAASFYSELH